MSQGIEDGEVEQIALQLLVLGDEVDDVDQLERDYSVEEGYQCSVLVDGEVHLHHTRLVLGFYLCLQVR